MAAPALESGDLVGDAAQPGRRGRGAHRLRRLTIRRLFWLGQILVTIAVSLLLGVGLYSNQQADLVRSELKADALQLEAMTRIQVDYNRYAEQIAEVIVLGDAQLAGLGRAGRALDASLGHLADILAENQTTEPTIYRPLPGGEYDRLVRLRALLAELEGVVAQVGDSIAAGRTETARRQFADLIENDLDRRIKAAIAATIEAERQEVALGELAKDDLTRRTRLVFFAMAGASIALSFAAGAAYYRRISDPVQQLMRGVEALEQGNLDWRIGDLGADELGALARRFDVMAEELQRRDAILEQQVRLRTADLSAANHRLRELDDRRIRFLAEISHELRTPLTVLRGEADVTLRHGGDDGAVYRQTLGRVVEKARQMGRLVDDLLLLARSDAGDVQIDRQPVDICGVVAAAVGDTAVLAERADIEVALRLPENPQPLIGDAARLHQAVTIGLDNAVKYSPAGGVVAIRVKIRDGLAVIAISDQGIGIDPIERRRAFERFYRGRDPQTRQPRGEGLGLPIAKWIVEAHGGLIDLQPDPVRGTILTMCLPLQHGDGEDT